MARPGVEASENTDPRWYVLSVRPRHENSAATALRNEGLEEFLPLYRSRRIWSDRIKELELPLFAGYVFCRFAMERRSSILKMPSVTSIVGFGSSGPAPVADREIASLRTMVGSGLALSPWPFLRVGQRILVDHGPLRGVEGIIIQVKNSARVVASISLLQRSVAVEIDTAFLVRVGDLSSPCKPQRIASKGHQWTGMIKVY